MGSGWSAAFLALEPWDEFPDSKVLDEGLKDWVSVEFDVLNLDLGLVWDEVHLSFSLLL